MSDKDDLSFDSLFDETDSENSSASEEDFFSFDEESSDSQSVSDELSMELEGDSDDSNIDFDEPSAEPINVDNDNNKAPQNVPKTDSMDSTTTTTTTTSPSSSKRSSRDFEPNMDILLITAQSSFIVDGINNLRDKNYSSKAYTTYLESINGINLYIKIIERNDYNKFNLLTSEEEECREIEQVAFSLYKSKYHDFPETDSNKLIALDILKNKLKIAYNKALINKAKGATKKYFLYSGGLNEDIIDENIKKNKGFPAEIAKLKQLISLGINLIKIGESEIVPGMKGREVNVFIIKTSEMLAYYFNRVGDKNEAMEFKKINDNYSKYFIIR